MGYRFVKFDGLSNFIEDTIYVFEQAYPGFLTHGVWSDPSSLALFEVYPEFQCGLVEINTQRMVAQVNCLPLEWTGSLNELPDKGCDWALAKGFSDQGKDRKANALCVVSISILPEYQGKGLSQLMIDHMKKLAQSYDLGSLIMAARPSLKHLYPLTPIENYITWQNKSGYLFDPWLRVNLKQGAEIANICFRSTTISDTISGWENRVGMSFPESGDYVFPDGLVPVRINYADNTGTYVEPNVWIYYNNFY